MTDQKQALKELIIEALDLEDITPNDIIDDEPLFIEGLGLDSIDALELGLAVRKKHNIKLDSNSDETKKHFFSVSTLAAFISSQKAS